MESIKAKTRHLSIALYSYTLCYTKTPNGWHLRSTFPSKIWKHVLAKLVAITRIDVSRFRETQILTKTYKIDYNKNPKMEEYWDGCTYHDEIGVQTPAPRCQCFQSNIAHAVRPNRASDDRTHRWKRNREGSRRARRQQAATTRRRGERVSG